MSATKPLYDLVLMLDTSAEDSRRNEIVRAAEETVSSNGELVTKQEWGPRQMAFEIRHKKDADYTLLQFHGTPEVLERLDRQLRIIDEVIRYRIVKLAPGTPPPVEQRPEPRPSSASVEDAAEDAPAEDAATEAAPADPAPTEDAPVEDAPVEASATEAAPVDPAPTEAPATADTDTDTEPVAAPE